MLEEEVFLAWTIGQLTGPMVMFFLLHRTGLNVGWSNQEFVFHDEVLGALNTLALHDPNSDFDQKLRYVPPTKTQELMAGRLIRCFSDAGSPPEGMSPQSAFDELGGGKSLYNEEPKNLAAYDFKKLKVLHSTLHPRSLDTVLPKHAKSILCRFSTMIEKSKDEIYAGGPIDIVPYWDPILKKSNGELDRLVVGLANQGLITFRVGIKERIGMFFVKKKTPEWPIGD